MFAATTRNVVETARQHHEMSPIATVALGRLLTGGAMMGTMMKNDSDVVTIQIKGNGPIGAMTVTADSKGRVKGFVANPQVMLPLKDTILVTSEIADDLTYYFATSEQVPSSVGLGVLMNKDNTVEQAGGFIIQLMPDAKEETIEKLEARIKEVKSVTQLLEEGMTPEEILEHILGDMGLEILDKTPTEFYCNCSKERVAMAIMSVGKDEIDQMIEEGNPIEVKCHFCNTAYNFSIDDLKHLRELCEKRR